MSKICPICKNSFTNVRHPEAICCSKSCAAKLRHAKEGTKIAYCKQCCKVFKLKDRSWQFCSQKCWQLFQHKRKINICEYCGKEFESVISGNPRHCSFDCKKTNKATAHFGEKHPRWNGGIRKVSGYIYTYSPNHKLANKKCVPEHILVVEKAGFEIREKGQVHHINEIKDDNRLENLYLFPSFSNHISYHRKFQLGECEKIIKSNLI